MVLGLGTVVLGAAVIVFSVVVARGGEVRTSYTQAYGVRRAAQVVSVDEGTGKQPTTLTVRLSEPVDGRGTTTVYVKDSPVYSVGASVTVVVDPQDPGYAEIPGVPFTPSGVWQFMVGFGLCIMLTVPAGLGIEHLVKVRRRRRVTPPAPLT